MVREARDMEHVPSADSLLPILDGPPAGTPASRLSLHLQEGSGPGDVYEVTNVNQVPLHPFRPCGS